MFKKILFGMSALALFAACTDDYTDWADPQHNDGVPVITVAMTVTPEVDAVVLENLTEETMKLFTAELPENATIEGFNVQLEDDGSNNPEAKWDYNIAADADGYIFVEDLQEAITSMFNKEAVERHLMATVTANATVQGSSSTIVVKLVGEPFVFTVTPKAPEFAEYIYEIGNSQGWSRTSPLYCENGDGIYVGYAFLDGGFKFKPQEGNTDWSGDFGQDPEGEEGALVVDGETDCQAEPGFYVITVNMVNMTYELTLINYVDIAGNAEGGSWDEGQGIRMVYNTQEGCWEADATLTGEFKFRGNGTWANADGNWGGSLDNVWNGSNANLLPETPGERVHVKFFAICNTKSYAELSPVQDPTGTGTNGNGN